METVKTREEVNLDLETNLQRIPSRGSQLCYLHPFGGNLQFSTEHTGK